MTLHLDTSSSNVDAIPQRIRDRAKPIWYDNGHDDWTGESYLPANGSEGDIFMDHWCFQCQKDIHEDCPILTTALCSNETLPEWVYYKVYPVCTAFVQRVGGGES